MLKEFTKLLMIILNSKTWTKTLRCWEKDDSNEFSENLTNSKLSPIKSTTQSTQRDLSLQEFTDYLGCINLVMILTRYLFVLLKQ